MLWDYYILSIEDIFLKYLSFYVCFDYLENYGLLYCEIYSYFIKVMNYNFFFVIMVNDLMKL